jgi:hypothetical protein
MFISKRHVVPAALGGIVLGAMGGAAAASLARQAAAADGRQADVHAMGEHVMPFDLEATTHVFEMTASGGVQDVIAYDPADADHQGGGSGTPDLLA